jgi:hypothetical protein
MGGCGVYILEDARHWIGLLQYNPSTPLTLAGIIAKIRALLLAANWSLSLGYI